MRLDSGNLWPLSLESPDPQLALPFLLQAARTQGGAEEDAVKGVINDLLTGKQSSQGSEHDLPAIMPSTACPRPLLLCGDVGLARPLPPRPLDLQGPEGCRQPPAAANVPPQAPT